MLKNKLLQSLSASKVESVADAIDFDGTNDYLSRGSDLVGNADGKTFTFSAWVYSNSFSSAGYIYDAYDSGTSGGLRVWVTSSGKLNITSANLAATTNLYSFPQDSNALSSFYHILISIDLSDTAKRYIYINDVLQIVTWSTYNNSAINFTTPSHTIGAATDVSSKLKGRLAHVFLDYTYRDLSIEANRRLFITADRKPALNQQALNPILYLPLNDPTQPGKNLGTGGDFALTGVVARSGRGPSQFNAPYSDLDGSADYLSRTTALAGIAGGKRATVAFSFNADSFSSYWHVLSLSNNDPADRFYVRITPTGVLSIVGQSEATANVFSYQSISGAFKPGRNYVVVASFDVSISSYKVTANGEVITADGSPIFNPSQDVAFVQPQTYIGNAKFNTDKINGRLGNIFFDTKYIDLSIPANLAKFVTGTGIDAKPVDLGANGELPFGTPPLIYLPMYGNNAGKNYGTGGDFTVNSGPFPGARGSNEFWGNKASFNPSGTYLHKTGNIITVNSKVFSFNYFINLNNTTAFKTFLQSRFAGSLHFEIGADTNRLTISANGVSGQVLNIRTAGILNPSVDLHICGSFNMSNQSVSKIFVNGASVSLQDVFSFVDEVVTFSNINSTSIGATTAGGTGTDGKLSEFYFTTDYIDFSQEANRLKFRDAFGNPVDLTPQIEAGTLPKPAIYMRFDPANFGKNSGTGGDFTVNGTITDGGQL